VKNVLLIFPILRRRTYTFRTIKKSSNFAAVRTDMFPNNDYFDLAKNLQGRELLEFE
jgi:hypothetical protein